MSDFRCIELGDEPRQPSRFLTYHPSHLASQSFRLAALLSLGAGLTMSLCSNVDQYMHLRLFGTVFSCPITVSDLVLKAIKAERNRTQPRSSHETSSFMKFENVTAQTRSRLVIALRLGDF